MAFELPGLPFDPSALEPWTSAETFSFHHGKHHAGYINKLNTAINATKWENTDIIAIISGNRDNPGIFNSAAQHYNHDFFWKCLTPETQEMPANLKEKIEQSFGTVDEFKKEFGEKAAKLFGSGWAWLVENNGSMQIMQYKDADTPAGTEYTPLLTLDVWEHAYYIDHRNNRGGFIEGFWNHVNWEFVSKNLI